MPSSPKITIASYDVAETMLESSVGDQLTHVISINDPGEYPPAPLKKRWGEQLILSFHDISRKEKTSGYDDFTAPGRDDVLRIIKFAGSIDSSSEVLCHCAAGISRSSAAALIILASKMSSSKPQNATAAIQAVLDIKNIIHPNALMVELADDELGYKGALIAAHAAAFTGGDLLWMPPELEDLTPDDFD